jgi:hypothetical protein
MYQMANSSSVQYCTHFPPAGLGHGPRGSSAPQPNNERNRTLFSGPLAPDNYIATAKSSPKLVAYFAHRLLRSGARDRSLILLGEGTQ